ncbi:flagellar basal body-associated FliL family protein [Halanaerobium congolense]|jgi:flagellar FliL protein|nr:flagellar basal body-associated FliL family protein [Halanaerobium congolense]
MKEAADMADTRNINYKMLTLIIVLVVIITGVASFTFFTYFSVADDEQEDFDIEDIRSTYTVGDFVVNIANNSQINFIRASLVFEIEEDELIEELEKRKPQVRDAIITTLRSQNESILKEANAQTIKKIIKSEVNEILRSGEVTNVWFTELVVQ